MRSILTVLVLNIFLFWAIILLVFSFQMGDKKIFWTQRVIAFILLLGVTGTLYANV